MFTIDEIKEKAVPIAKKFGLDELSLFGSYAKNKQKETSDVDFLIQCGDLKGYFQYFDLVGDLENVFKCHVDVIMDGIEDKDFLTHIKKEKKVLYVRER